MEIFCLLTRRGIFNGLLGSFLEEHAVGIHFFTTVLFSEGLSLLLSHSPHRHARFYLIPLIMEVISYLDFSKIPLSN